MSSAFSMLCNFKSIKFGLDAYLHAPSLENCLMVYYLYKNLKKKKIEMFYNTCFLGSIHESSTCSVKEIVLVNAFVVD